MSFPVLTSDGLSITCLLVTPDWQTQLSVSHHFPADLTEGLSGRAERRPEAEALLLTATVRLWATDAAAQALRQALATLGTAWVGLPLYADTFLGSAYSGRIYSAQRLINLTTPAIVAAGSSLNAGDTYAPLLVGHITELPPLEPLDAGYALSSVTVTEDSPWAFRIGVNATAVSSVFPGDLEPDWSTAPSQQPVHGLAFDRIGQTREQAISGQERALVWTAEAGFTLSTKADIAGLLAFFLATRGPWTAFAAPLWFTPGAASAEAPHATTCRFADRTLKLDFLTPAQASARLKLVQVPWEIEGVEGETPEQSARVFLYRFDYDVPGGYTWRYTNCWRSLTRTGDGTYAPAPMEHEALVSGLDLGNEALTLRSHVFSGNPLNLFNPPQLEGKLWLRVYEVTGDPLSPDAATLVWFGAVARAPQTGRSYSAECHWLGGLLEQELPRVRVGPNCNTTFLSSRCGHVAGDFEKSGTLDAASGNTVDLLAADAAAANTYAPGFFSVGTGLTYEARLVTASAPITGGQRLTLAAPLRQAAAGQTVTYRRTCDGTLATCQALDPDGWRARFRGQPFVPQVNFVLPTQISRARGKK